MRLNKDTLRAAIAIPAGLAIALAGRIFPGIVIAAFGVVMLAISWRFRHVLPADPITEEQLAKAMKLEKTDPAAAHALMDKAIAEDQMRRDAEMADLRARAATDRKAGKQLRSRLLGKLENARAVRRKLERSIQQMPNAAAVLEEIGREESATQRELAALEHYLEQSRP
jgi:hypothetical protein